MSSIRRAMRAYHCHACNQDFRDMVDLNDLTSVRCTHCQSDFFEEKRTFEENKESAQQQMPQQQQRPQMQMPERVQPQIPRMSQPQMNQMPQMHQQMHLPQATRMQQSAQAHGMRMPHVRQQQTVTRTYSPNGGWTQSVTISYGGGQPQINHSASHFGGQSQHQQLPNEFASAQHAQPHPQRHAHPQHQAHFPFDDDFFNPFQQMDSMFNGQMMGGQASQPRGQMNHGSIFDMMGGLGPIIFANGFPMGENQPRSRGCSEDFIQNLPQKEAGKKSDCYICLEPCKEGALSCELPCKHAFDRACIEHWLKDNDSCPVCRVKLDQQNRPQMQQPQQPQAQIFFF